MGAPPPLAHRPCGATRLQPPVEGGRCARPSPPTRQRRGRTHQAVRTSLLERAALRAERGSTAAVTPTTATTAAATTATATASPLARGRLKGRHTPPFTTVRPPAASHTTRTPTRTQSHLVSRTFHALSRLSSFEDAAAGIIL